MNSPRLPDRVVELKLSSKLCIDCHHVHLGGVSDLLEFCRHPMNLQDPSTVDGSTRTFFSPEYLRSDPRFCGPQGDWWQPQTRWRRFWRGLWGD